MLSLSEIQLISPAKKFRITGADPCSTEFLHLYEFLYTYIGRFKKEARTSEDLYRWVLNQRHQTLKQLSMTGLQNLAVAFTWTKIQYTRPILDNLRVDIYIEMKVMLSIQCKRNSILHLPDFNCVISPEE